jgi:hypothetical protein
MDTILGFVLEEQTMALRTMFPSKARVGDTVHFSFAHDRFKGQIITAFDVVINGKKIADPELVKANAKGKGSTSFVFKADAPGTYHFEIVPISGEDRGERRLSTLEVEA